MATPFKYQCSGGHEVTTPHEMSKCPAYVQGKRCPAELRRVR